MPKWKLCLLMVVLVFSFTVYGCGKKADGELMLKEIAFDVDRKHGNTVYIEESGQFVPYLVLTADYGGNVLLLREHVLDEDMLYSDIEYSYYRDSYVDRYLNEEFIYTLGEEVRGLIVESEIGITTESSYFSTEIIAEKINRKVFLLSTVEVGLTGFVFVADEGKPLKYFNDSQSRVVYDKGGATRAWWLRTPYLGASSGSDVVWAIGFEGGTAGGNQVHGLSPKLGVRPAFCLPGSLPVKTSEDVIAGRKVYVLADI